MDVIIIYVYVDWIGGIKMLKERGIKVYSIVLIVELVKNSGYEELFGDL